MISDKGLTIFKNFLQYLWYNKSSIIVRGALWAETTTAKTSFDTQRRTPCHTPQAELSSVENAQQRTE